MKLLEVIQASSRTPRGVRGLKSLPRGDRLDDRRRTPRGVRGLKCHLYTLAVQELKSHPSRGAWIEILVDDIESPDFGVAPLAGCVD